MNYICNYILMHYINSFCNVGIFETGAMQRNNRTLFSYVLKKKKKN